ncbi:MAG TPA: TetR/AcrR family transcriptional regulator [Gaiellaceae bacterium]|nr:TetR/AcrR family transcriptional regulator [Gaiellaceae bacterium]
MSTADKVDLRRERGRATRDVILAAARDVIGAHGYAATTTRSVADAAGVQLSLVHYHFGGKRQLLVALLEHENRRLLERQHALYAADEPLAIKWQRACAYLREDFGSGYVRVLWELWAAGLAEPELAERWRESLLGWFDLLEGVVTAWAAEQDVELPLPPRAVATLVGNAFLGAEAQLLAGMDESEVPNLEALEAFGRLIARAEATSADGGGG